ncbi:electron transport complex subunit RsxE [Candidatus Margulisiibacteriota bacterium]
MQLTSEFTKGFFDQNPVFKILLGLCPTLAVTTGVINGIGMGLAATFVLFFSNLLVSMIRNITPKKIRIPVFIIIIATFTTIVDLLMAAYLPPLHKALGVFVPLIVVNCIIFGRAEAFASKNNVISSLFDALGMGFGFTFALICIGGVREILGSGAIIGFQVLPAAYKPMLIMILPPGAFLTLGIITGFFNLKKKETKLTCTS